MNFPSAVMSAPRGVDFAITVAGCIAVEMFCLDRLTLAEQNFCCSLVD